MEADDPGRWQAALTPSGHVALDALMRRGPQVLVTSHERPAEEYLALAFLLRSAGMPLVAAANTGSLEMPVDFAVPTRDPTHLLRLLTTIRRGGAVLFVVFRKPLLPRGAVPGEAMTDRLVPPLGPLALARRAQVPLSLVRLDLRGRRARVGLTQQQWEDPGGDLGPATERLVDDLAWFAR